jgi:hypothetical protein
MQKSFTVEDADRMLPLVSRIVRDVVEQTRRWQERVRAYEVLGASASPDHPDPELGRLQREIQQLAADIDGFIAELAALGVELKDLETGLVDFPAEMDGRPVYLCWRYGEPAVRHWHERDAGYRGRQPIVPQLQA